MNFEPLTKWLSTRGAHPYSGRALECVYALSNVHYTNQEVQEALKQAQARPLESRVGLVRLLQLMLIIEAR